MCKIEKWKRKKTLEYRFLAVDLVQKNYFGITLTEIADSFLKHGC